MHVDAYLKPRPNGTPNSSQLEPSYKIKTCISGWPNGTAKSSQLARNHSIVWIRPRSHNNNKTTWRELAWVGWKWTNGGKLGSSWAKIWAWSNSSQLDPTRANSSQVGGQTIPNSIEVVNLARLGLSWEDRLTICLAGNEVVGKLSPGMGTLIAGEPFLGRWQRVRLMADRWLPVRTLTISMTLIESIDITHRPTFTITGLPSVKAERFTMNNDNRTVIIRVITKSVDWKRQVLYGKSEGYEPNKFEEIVTPATLFVLEAHTSISLATKALDFDREKKKLPSSSKHDTCGAGNLQLRLRE